jgi:hypothetical protein
MTMLIWKMSGSSYRSYGMTRISMRWVSKEGVETLSGVHGILTAFSRCR